MKSRITIEVDFDNGNPYFRVAEDANSDDVRDKLVTHFRQKLGGTSSWCKVYFNNPYHELTQLNRWLIKPISPEQLRDEAEIMIEQARLLEAVPKQDMVTH